MTTPIRPLRQTTHMKKIWIVVASALIIGAGQLSAADTLTEALQKGLFEEEANQNLDAAIKAYQDVLSRADEQRRVAATALFRLAECYRKQGKTNEAAGEYRRVVRDYADQTTLANLSRQNLTGLGVSAPGVAAAGATTPDGTTVASTDEEEKEIRRIKALIKDSPDLINARNQEIYRTGSGDSTRTYSGTVLHLSAYKGHLQVARYLLENGANVNAISSEDLTPLHYAAQNGHRNLAELLLSKGASPNFGAGTSYRGTPLHAASTKGFPAVAQVLLAHNADVNATDGSGKTPLHAAIEAGFLPVAELLVARGANVNAVYLNPYQPYSSSPATRLEPYDGTPLHFAVQKDNLEITKLLLSKGADVNARSGAGLTPLYYLGYNRSEMAALLLENKADVNAQGSSDSRFSGWTPLHIALFHRATNVVQLLLDKGANPNLVMENPKTLEFRTALHNAVEYGYAREVELLLDHKADVNALDFLDNTPLIRATKKNDASILKVLLAHDADINAVDSNGNTALAIAVQSDQKQVAELLLAKGADPNGVNGNGASLLYVAMGSPGQTGQGLRTIPAPMPVPRATPAPKPEPKSGKTMVELLVDYKADVNAPVTREAAPNTALQYVVVYRMTNWVRLFLDKGGDPNIPFAHPEVNNRTPLHVAVEQQALAIAEMLLTHKADVNALDDYGWTPLFRAINKGDSKMVELLLSHNADVAALNRDGATPLAKAVEFKNVAIVEQLLEKGANPNVSSSGVPLLHRAVSPATQTALGGVATYSLGGPGVPYTGVPSGGVPLPTVPGRSVRQLGVNPTANPIPAPASSSKPPPKIEKSILELLLQYKADPNIRATILEQESQTPLHIAARAGNETAAKLLLAYKADVNAGDNLGVTPLHVAAQSQSSSFVELLLTNKANVNAANSSGATPLHYAAAYSGNTNAISVLVEHGGDINACDRDGDSPLLRLLQTRNIGLNQASDYNFTEFMLRLGADVTKSCDGKPSPFEFAIKRGFAENIVDLLRRFHPAKLSRVRLSGPVQQFAWYFETTKAATLSQAIGAVGLGEKANPRNISVLRDDPKTGLKEQRGYDLVAIRLKDAPDVPLRDGDKIIVAER